MIVHRSILLFFIQCVAIHALAATNLGLVGVAEIAPDARDLNGETMGGFGSGLCWDRDAQVLYCLSDRGPLDGTVDYRPRVHRCRFSIDMGKQSFTNGHRNITLTPEATILLRDDSGKVFSGHDADDSTCLAYPRVAETTVSGVPRAIDPEAIARGMDGTFYIGDEYGPYIYQFDNDFKLLRTIVPPAHVIPQRLRDGELERNFSAVGESDSGRRANKGFEGVSVSPDGRFLFAMLQAPLVQDGKTQNDSRNTRLFVWALFPDHEPKLTAEYFYQLDLLDSGKAAHQNEILALNDTTLLVLERDNRGLGAGNDKKLCRIYQASLRGATNLHNQPGIVPVSKTLLIDLLDREQLAKAGFADTRSIPEKWESMTLVEHSSLPANQYLLFVGVDNDFKAREVFVKTTAAEGGTNLNVVSQTAQEMPTLVFAFRVELPEYVPPVPQKLNSQNKPNSNGGS